jgi:hypothetical protein
MSNKQLAKDVAKRLDARRRNRRLLFLLAILALVLLLAKYLGFGGGWGLGFLKGKGDGEGSGHQAQPAVAMADAGPQRCTVRVSSEGISVDGTKKTRDEAVELCKKTEGAMVTVTGDARQGDWDELRAALQATSVKIYIRGELWDGKSEVKPGGGSGSATP